MTRREFLSWLGIGAGVATIAPSALITEPVVAAEYPTLYFTGLKPDMNAQRMAGQFLWQVKYVDVDGKSGFTPWYCNVSVDLSGLRHGAPVEYIRTQFQNSAYSVAQMMDRIMSDGAKGLVQTGRYEMVENEDFNPELPESYGWYEDEVFNPRFIQSGVPIMKQVRSFEIVPWNDGIGDGWNIDKMTALASEQLKKWIHA